MPYTLKTFKLTDKQGRRMDTPVHQAEPVSLFGVEGFSYHRKGDRPMWFISHCETGALAGDGETKESALMCAMLRAKNANNVRRAIEECRSKIQSGQGE